jgi:hypothetical protein
VLGSQMSGVALGDVGLKPIWMELNASTRMQFPAKVFASPDRELGGLSIVVLTASPRLDGIVPPSRG